MQTITCSVYYYKLWGMIKRNKQKEQAVALMDQYAVWHYAANIGICVTRTFGTMYAILCREQTSNSLLNLGNILKMNPKMKVTIRLR